MALNYICILYYSSTLVSIRLLNFNTNSVRDMPGLSNLQNYVAQNHKMGIIMVMKGNKLNVPIMLPWRTWIKSSYQNKTKHNKEIELPTQRNWVTKTKQNTTKTSKLPNKTKKSSYQNKTKNWIYQNKTKKLSYQNKTKQNTTKPEPYAQCCGCRDHFAYVLSQWETMLQCNIVSHWLDANTKWSLGLCHISSLQWRHHGRDGISNCQPHHCLLNRLFRHRSKQSIKASRHWPLCVEFTGHRWIPRTNGQ